MVVIWFGLGLVFVCWFGFGGFAVVVVFVCGGCFLVLGFYSSIANKWLKK